MKSLKRKVVLAILCIFCLAMIASVSHTAPTYERDTLKKLILKLNTKDFDNRFNSQNIESYVDALMKLQKNGIEIYWSLIKDLTIEKANNPLFMENMIKLQQGGVRADYPLKCLDIAHGTNSEFINAVMKLCKNKNKNNLSDWAMLARYLTTEKIISKRYMDNIHRLSESLSHPPPLNDLIEAISLEAGEKDWLIDTCIELNEAGVNFGYASLKEIFEMHKNKKFFEDLKENCFFLKEKGIDFKKSEIGLYSCELLRRVADNGFVKGILYLRERGLPITEGLIWNFSREKMRDKEYLDAVVFLYQNGVFSSQKDRYAYLIDEFPVPENLGKKSVDYYLISNLSIEKAVDKQCIASIIKFHKAGLTAWEGLGSLDIEKLKSGGFFEKIIQIKNKLKKQGHGISLGILASDLSIEMVENEEFISILVENEGYIFPSAETYALRKQSEPKLLKELFSYGEMRNSWGSAWEELFPLTMEHLNKAVSLMRKEKDSIALWAIEREFRPLLEMPARKMNDLHDQPDEWRLKVIEGALLETLYYVVAFTDDLYTSTLNLISQKLREEMEKRDMDLLELVEKADPEHRWFSRFIYQLAQYDRLAYVMEGMDENSSREILSMFIRQLEKSKNTLEHAFYLGAATGAMLREENKNENLSRILANELFFWKENFRAKGKKDEATLLEIIISLYADHFTGKYEKTAEDLREVFKVSSDEILNLKELADRKGILHTLMVFYDDKDGRTSFFHFLNQRRKTKWEIEEKEGFVILKKSSPDPKNPIQEIRIYANNPNDTAKNQSLLRDYLEKNNIEPKVIVHRGHSYHTGWTLDKIGSRTKMVFLGSCGGFKETERILKDNINMLIFCTANMGTMVVNDPLLDYIDQAFLEGKTSLPDIWETATAKIEDPRKNGYIAPYKNIGQKIYKAYMIHKDKSYLEADLSENS